MNKKQLAAALIVAAIVLASGFGLLYASDRYLHGYRFKDRQGNIVHIVSLVHKDIWNDVLRNPVISLLGIVCLGCYYIYECRDKKK